MPKHTLTKQAVIEAASHLAATGIFPTLAAVRKQLGGRGSQSTIHKYLKQWTQACIQRGAMGVSTLDPAEIQSLLTEKYKLEKIIAKQIEQNTVLSAQLITAEKRIIEAQEKGKQSEIELQNLREQLLQAEVKYQAIEGAYQAMREEREVVLQTILEDKNQQIEALKQELQEVNNVTLTKVIEMGYRGDEALMDEKIKTLNLQEKVSALDKLVASLQQQLLREQQANQPLRNEIERNKRLIEKSLSFEQLQITSIEETGKF